MVLTAVIPDCHVPFEDKGKVAFVLDWLTKHKADRIVLLGDVLELHALSTHRKDPRWEDQLYKELDAGRKFFEALRKAAPRSEITYIEGNHERRLRTYVQGRAPAMRLLGISIPDYLKLDGFGVKWHDNDRKGVRVPVGQGQVAYCYHGDQAKRSSKFPGGVAWGMAERLCHNVIIGHTHQAALMAGVRANRPIFAAEAGCLINARHKVFDYAGLTPQWTHAFLVCDSEQRESPYPQIIRPTR